MGNRRFTQVATSDDEDEAVQPHQQRTWKRMRLMEEDKLDNDNENEEEVGQEPPQLVEDAKPIDEPIRFSGKGRGRKKHYESFEFDGIQYSLGLVLLTLFCSQDITQGNNGNVIVTGQWFYRPEEAEKKSGGNWKSCDTRELFYSFHRDNVPAEAVMHKCVVHFVPLHKQLPKRKDHPGFIVQKVYDDLLEEDNDNDDEIKEEGPQPLEDAKPIGEPVRFSGKGRGRKKHYESFEFDGIQYSLEDPVLLVPEEKGQKPYVAIIKDITQGNNGNVIVTGQWFYRPEEAEKKSGGNWKSCDTRELFYSFHRDNVPAEAVMHKCAVHFIPLHKQLPKRKDHPGFIVQKVYDTVERKLWRLSDKDYEDIKQSEIDELVQKTLRRIGELLDIEPEEAPADDEDQLKVRVGHSVGKPF
uniref:BAH domain-containing protein n=1 Tax=Cajanus cajan TaxID=3821 RepID=A0A151R8D8_CAJCA|nr:hypothetical protein KK1_039861 [Cajanus cajan]